MDSNNFKRTPISSLFKLSLPIKFKGFFFPREYHIFNKAFLVEIHVHDKNFSTSTHGRLRKEGSCKFMRVFCSLSQLSIVVWSIIGLSEYLLCLCFRGTLVGAVTRHSLAARYEETGNRNFSLLC